MPSDLLAATAALEGGDYPSAAQFFTELTRQQPTNAGCWLGLGLARQAQGQHTAAKPAFARALQIEPENLPAHFALTASLLALGEHWPALHQARKATKLAPQSPLAKFNLGVVFEAMRNPGEALRCYDDALALDPALAEALQNRGALLAALGRHPEAIANNRRFCELHPELFAAWFNLGDSCLAAGEFAEAAQAFQQALQRQPDHVRALLHGGFALSLQEDFALAQSLLDRASALAPEQVRQYQQVIFGRDCSSESRLDARTLYLLRHFELSEKCDWRQHARFLDNFAAILRQDSPPDDTALAFRAMVMGVPPPLQLRLARRIADRFTVAAPPLWKRRDKSPDNGKIRIAYLSPDFRNHPLGFLIAPLFAQHDRSRFEVFAYALGGDDRSPTRQTIVAGCDHFADLAALTDDAAAARIADDRIDILVDLAGYLNLPRPGLLARKPAPLNLSWIGYIATTGAPWIDYLLADPTAFPEECSPFYAEKLLRLNGGLFYCGYASEALAAPPTRAAAGLPEEGLVLAAMHNPYKICPEVFALWLRLLAEHPGSCLWLLKINPEAEQSLRAQAEAQGIAGSRLIFAPFLPHRAHLARLQLADLALDTWQCNGVTTTADALCAGLPVVTCPGETPIQRMAASLLRMAGMPELIAPDPAAYEALLRKLLASADVRQACREKLRQQRQSALFFHPQRWVRHYEHALQAIWQRHRTGQPPQKLSL